MVGASCDLFFDFEWRGVIGHNHPRFHGLQDLSLAIKERARIFDHQPVIVLTTAEEEPPFQEFFSQGVYIAAVRIDDFLQTTVDHDRSALFFLNQLSLSRQSGLASLPVSLRALESATSEDIERTVETIISEGGTSLLEALLRSAEIGLQKQLLSSDIATLSEVFASNDATLLARVAETSRKAEAIRVFQGLLDADAAEQSFQNWFQANAWVMGTTCVRILDDRRIDVENIADYVVESLDGFADVVEIKRPGLPFWATTRDHGNYVPHQELVKAVTQAQNYQLELEREMDSGKTRRRLKDVPIAKPSSLLIHGRSADWDEEQLTAQRVLNAGLSNVSVLTYDQVLKRARALTGPGSSGLMVGIV